MPISRSDRISGTLYALAADAEAAKSAVLEALRDERKKSNVFDHEHEAREALQTTTWAGGETRRVYAVRLDIRPAKP
ncbi:hypothetical protein [Streptomyces nanshensis]|uniref:Uncharacterized protein n=1 Tax=Streptomyces nanshensis TaxID=518642 RepID=A0A1E7KZC8_9ACTN|nr:hypothetical protein [Streptomyces nanshensis]OEV09265.1 hypothetical protein AN218_22690 [Streptomyces nanshensis]